MTPADTTTPAPRLTAAGYAAIGLLAGVLATHTCGLILAPRLADSSPLLLLLLRPTPTTLLLVGGRVDPRAAFAVTVPPRVLLDLAYFLVARHGALVVLHRFRLGRALIKPARAGVTERGLRLLAMVWASTPVDLALGITTTTTRRFLLCCGIGSAVSTTFYLVASRRLRSPLDPVVTWMSANAASLTWGIVAVLAVGAAVLLLRRR